MKPSTPSFAGIATGLLALGGSVSAHTWLEEILRIADGKFVGTIGYPRKYMPRDAPGFADTLAQNKILFGAGEEIPDTQLMCRADQTMNSYSDTYPKLTAKAGEWLALTYLENGHTTLKTDFKPANGGTVFVYGTTEPKSSTKETLNSIHMQWNADGTGGDGRGKLLATRNYDNGVCHEQNGGEESEARQAATGVNMLRCQTDIQLPDDLDEGTYTLYWVWEWPEMAADVDISSATGTESLSETSNTEMYTTCLDVEITAGDLEDTADPLEPAGSPTNDADSSQLDSKFQVTKNLESLVSGNDDRDDSPEESASPSEPSETNSEQTPEPTSTEAEAQPSTTEIAEQPTETEDGRIVTVTDVVTMSIPDVVTQTISIGNGVTTTLPVVAPTDGTTMTTHTRKSSSTNSEESPGQTSAAGEEGPPQTTGSGIEPTQFLGAKFRRAAWN
ncbi:hypothetical protein MKZ38_008887 [Zalerion maritima]|uniref:DUF7492 domain-containing protein n=1 Tax=Zalerion maritima TaxID=339359 RepID=A0AAD5RVW9_9PEZI|nr:hypothetical protein MKZ38_008887 [Zalerion maritima]